MIRSVGPIGPVKVAGKVVVALRYDLLAILAVAAVLVPIPDSLQLENAVAALSVLGIAASVFIAFRNTNAYGRWWEARTLWGAVINDCRSMHNDLCAVDDGSPEMAAVLDRMRRRQVRFAWQLAAELRGVAPPPGITDLTPEDASDTTANSLLNRVAHDVRALTAGGHIDDQARVMLMTVNRGLVSSQGGLERIRNQPIPVHYDLFIRGLAWLFAIIAFNRFDGEGHYSGSIIVGFLLMGVFVIAERLGHFIEQPMSNRVFDLPMYRFCTTIAASLLGRDHPLATPREGDRATVWW